MEAHSTDGAVFLLLRRRFLVFEAHLWESERLRDGHQTYDGGQRFTASGNGRNGEFDHLQTEDVYWRTLAKMESIAPELAGLIERGSELPTTCRSEA